MHTKTFLLLSIALALGAQTVTGQRTDVSAKIKTETGLHEITFALPEGSILVYLPDDITAGDTVSGTLTMAPSGNDESQRSHNQDELQEYAIALEKQQTTVSEPSFKWAIPVTFSSRATSLILKDKQGNEVTRVSIAVAPKSRTGSSSDFEVPSIGQQWRPIEVRGSFDGDFNTTVVKIGAQDLPKLAESPRKIVARDTSGITGVTEIEIAENDRSGKSQFRSIGVQLTAPQVQLVRGEQTTMTVVVNGLQELRENVSLELENKSTNVISIAGGDMQKINISPSQVQGGSFTTERVLTGIRSGAFSIVASIVTTKQIIVRGVKRS